MRKSKKDPRTDSDAPYLEDEMDLIAHHDAEGNALIDFCPSSPASEIPFDVEPRDTVKVEWLDAVTGYLYIVEVPAPGDGEVLPPVPTRPASWSGLVSFAQLDLKDLEWMGGYAGAGNDTTMVLDVPEWSNEDAINQWIAQCRPCNQPTILI